MKKIILSIFAIIAVASMDAQVVIKYPSGNATAFTLSAGATNNITANNTMNYVSSVTTLTAATTLSMTIAPNLKAGSIFNLVVKTTGTETVTFTGAIVAPVITGVAGKTVSQSFVYNGVNFYPMGAKIQVD